MVANTLVTCLKPVLTYRQTSHISRNLVGYKLVDHADLVGASPVGAAPTMFFVDLAPGFNGLDKTAARRIEKHYNFLIFGSNLTLSIGTPPHISITPSTITSAVSPGTSILSASCRELQKYLGTSSVSWSWTRWADDGPWSSCSAPRASYASYVCHS